MVRGFLRLIGGMKSDRDGMDVGAGFAIMVAYLIAGTLVF